MQNSVWDLEELSRIRNGDRLLPSQPLLSKQFTGDRSRFFEQLENLLLSVQQHKSVEEKWDLTLKPGVTYASLGADIGTLYFYQLLLRLGGIKNVLELGTYIGVSALFLAEAVGKSGKVTTVEFGEEFYNIAKGNFERNGYADRIEQVHGCAVETLQKYAKKKRAFDCIIIDAAKERYADMLEPALVCLSEDGLLLVDDIFFQGDTLNDVPHSPKGAGVRKLVEKAALLKDDYVRVILPIGNGLLLICARR